MFQWLVADREQELWAGARVRAQFGRAIARGGQTKYRRSVCADRTPCDLVAGVCDRRLVKLCKKKTRRDLRHTLAVADVVSSFVFTGSLLPQTDPG